MARKIKKIALNLNKLIDYLLYLWVFLMPLQTRLIYILSHESRQMVRTFLPGTFWKYDIGDFYATEFLILFVAFLVLYNFFRSKQYYKLGKKLLSSFNPKITLAKIIALVLLYLLLNTFWSEDHYLSLLKLIHLLLVVLGVSLVYYRKLDWRRVCLALVAAGLIQGIMAVDQFLAQKVLANKYLGISRQIPHVLGVSVIMSGSERWLRAYGGLPHPNILGGFLVYVFIFLIFLIGFILKARHDGKLNFKDDKKRKLFLLSLYGALFFIFSGLLLTFSRAAWLVSFLAYLFYVLFVFFRLKTNSVKQALKKITLIVISTAIFWLAVSPEPFITRIKGQEVLEKYSNAERVRSLYDSRIVIKDYFWRGAGFGVYPEILATKYPREQFLSNHPVHNVYLLLLAEVGIGGLLLFLFLLFWVWHKARHKPLASWVLFALLISMMFDHWWISLYFGNYLLAVLLLILIMAKEENY